jgi:hypothetical protein
MFPLDRESRADLPDTVIGLEGILPAEISVSTRGK